MFFFNSKAYASTFNSINDRIIWEKYSYAPNLFLLQPQTILAPTYYFEDCEVLPIPFSEGFNTDSETFSCWTILDLNNDGTEFTGQFINYQWTYFEGNRSMYYSKFSANHNDWLISPKFQNAATAYKMSFYYRTNNASPFSVKFSDSGVSLADFEEIVPASELGVTNGEWVKKIVYLTDVSADFNIAFYAGNTSTAASKSFYIDMFSIEPATGCQDPYNVVQNQATENSVEVSWDQFGAPTSWEVVILPYGEGLEEEDLDAITVTGESSVTIEDLDPGILYEVFVRAICGTDNTSSWSEAGVVATQPINNTCLDSISLIVNDTSVCNESLETSIIGASLSMSQGADCVSNPKSDVWYSFVATSAMHDVNIDNVESAYSNSPMLYMAIYRGVCGNLQELGCEGTSFGEASFMRVGDLVVGEKYYVRIMSRESNDVNFEICISTPLPSIITSVSGADYTVEELVREVLVQAPCNLVSNITFKTGISFVEEGSNGIGYFNKNNSIFGFEDGVILSTNDVKYAQGPGGGSEGFDGDYWLGDSDLNVVLAENDQPGETLNASVLEFDFIPLKDSIKFDFIFASNEYGQYQCDFTDVFAFFLTDLVTNTTTNLAVVPGTDTPVSVTTIRDAAYEGWDDCGDANAEYFDKFYGEDGLPEKDNPINYAGMTVPMSAISEVVPGRKYHIKLAIADYDDSGYNSAVFLKGGSFDLGEIDFGEDLTVDGGSALCNDASYTLNSGLNPELVEISWLKDGELIPGANEPIYVVTEQGEYTVVGTYIAVDGCEVSKSILVEFYETLESELTQPENMDYCKNSLVDTIDLTMAEGQLFAGIDNVSVFEVSYYETSSDREANENEIVDAVNYPIPTGGTKTIYLLITNSETGCKGFFEFKLIPVSAVVPVSPGNQQVCASYIFPKLPKDQFYFTESQGNGVEYKAGDVLGVPGKHKIYIYSLSGNCYEEVSYNVSVTAPVDAFELEDVVLRCENYILPNLPFGSKYYTDSNEGGIELLADTEILLSQKIYIFTKSEEGPDYCTAESSFTVTYEECPIQKGISPNGDGINDYLDLRAHGVSSIKIYNRLGAEVYSHGVGYTNQWFGQAKSSNELLPDGTYYYVIISHGKTKTGWIQINK